MRKIVTVSAFLIMLTALLLAGQASGRKLETAYPAMPSTDIPTTTTTLLPVYFRYVFVFALVSAGVIVFGSMLFAGFSYLTSMGNPAALKDSLDRMMSSFLGAIILLSSYLLLNTINPKLTIMNPSGIKIDRAIKIYNGIGGNTNLKTSVADLLLFEGGAISVQFIGTNSDEVDIRAYLKPNYDDTGAWEEVEGNNDDTIALSLGGPARSISIQWKLPGVYLFKDIDYEDSYRLYISSQGSMPDFNDEAESVKLKNSAAKFGKAGKGFAAVLHSDENLLGRCSVILSSVSNLDAKYIGLRQTSSITVFKGDRTRPASSTTDGVKFYDKDGNSLGSIYRDIEVSEVDSLDFDNMINSIEMNGNYIVILFRDEDFEGGCETFTRSDSNLIDNPIGRCSAIAPWPCPCIPALGWCAPCLRPCASSFIVYPTLP